MQDLPREGAKGKAGQNIATEGAAMPSGNKESFWVWVTKRKKKRQRTPPKIEALLNTGIFAPANLKNAE